MDHEAIQSQPATSGDSGNINLNHQLDRRPSTNGLAVTVEGIPRRTASLPAKSTAVRKTARRLSLAAPPNKSRQNQDALPASSSATLEQDPIPNNPKKECKDFDDVMENITTTNSYQKVLLFFKISPITSIQPILAFNVVFMLFTPLHWCINPNRAAYDDLEEYKHDNIPLVNETDGHSTYSSCTIYGPQRSELQCPYGWEFDKSDYQRTMVTQNNWVCDNARIPTLVFLAGSIGNAIGMLGFGLMSDSWGRKPTVFMAIITNVIFRLLSLFCGSNWILLCAVQFFAGCSNTAMYVFPSLIVAELCNKDERTKVYTITWTICMVGLSLLPPIAYLCGDWFYIGLSTAGLGCLMLFYYPYVPESPRWLLQKGRVDEAAAALKIIQDFNMKYAPGKKKANKNRKLSMINGTPPAPADEDTPTGSQNDNGRRLSCKSVSSTTPAQEAIGLENIKKLLVQVLQRQQNREESVSIAEGRGALLEDRSKASVIFTRRNMATNTILLAICWSMNTLIYNTMTFCATHMSGGSHLLNFFFLAIIEVPSGIFGGALTNKLGRRWTQTGAFGLCAVACFATSVMDHHWLIEVSLATVAKMLVTVSFLVVYCQATELFPTELRSTGGGIVSTVANFVCIAAPLISDLGSSNPTYPWIIMGFLAVVGMIAAAFLPETLHLGLPETVEEADAIGKGRKFWSIRTGNEENNIKTSGKSVELDLA